MAMLRVYFDTVITSGRVSRDLSPPEEMAAVDRLELFHEEGQIKRVSSKWSQIEQTRTKNPVTRFAFRERWNEVSVVQPDHKLLGFNSVDMGRRGFINSPLITDIVDEEVFTKLKAVGLEDTDAKHVMCAIVGKCDVFVTLDTKDILPRRVAVEAACPEIRIRKPTELLAELEGKSDCARGTLGEHRANLRWS
jgi:predicted nucleic acid-binding protein